MNITQSLPLLGGLSAQQFMKRYWQKKPLLIRQAIPNFKPLLSRSALFDLAQSEEVESRLVRYTTAQGWSVAHGPFPRRSLPALKQPQWTVLVQGVDLHVQSVHELMQDFRFVPEARLDDVMISYASDQGGVGPHYDNYDVFLLQAHGQRRWRIGRQKDLTLRDDVPMKVLAHFEPEQEFVLEPGDMLYLPPHYAHDGIALGECMTYSIGFRCPKRDELARELLQRLAEDADELLDETFYRDPRQQAVEQPGAIPQELQDFATQALQRLVQTPQALACALGEYMTEPKPQVWFESVPENQPLQPHQGVRLDKRTRMMFDAHHVFINGESYQASGRDATLMRELANTRQLNAQHIQKLSEGAYALLEQWHEAGWLQADSPPAMR